MPSRANQVKENKDEQENQKAVEEGEEAGSDQAVAIPRSRKALRPVFHGQERAERHDAA